MRILQGTISRRTAVAFATLIILSAVGTFYFHRVVASPYGHRHNIALSRGQESTEELFQDYLQDRKDSSDKWLSFMSIMATLFAVFFVYTGFKIDTTKDKVDEAEKRILETERKINEDIFEYATQLQYAMSFIVQKQYQKAIDTLTVLRSQYFVLKYDWKINTCCFFLAHCYYERGVTEQVKGDTQAAKEDFALAVEYINQAIADPLNPYKNEIINAFNTLDNQQTI